MRTKEALCVGKPHIAPTNDKDFHLLTNFKVKLVREPAYGKASFFRYIYKLPAIIF